MAYSSGTATSQHDLLDKLRLFLIDQSWTVNKWEDDTSSHYQSGLSTAGKRLHVQKTASDSTVMYFNFRSCVRAFPFNYYSSSSSGYGDYGQVYYSEITGIAMYGSTGYNASNDWDEQTGYPESTTSKTTGICINYVSGSFSYYFFATTDMVTVCVEYQSGKYQWLCFGQVQKFGTFTGGQFFAGSGDSYATAYAYKPVFLSHSAIDSTYGYIGACRVDADSKNTWRCFQSMRGGDNTQTLKERLRSSSIYGIYNYNSNSCNTFCSRLFQCSPNSFNGVSVFIPIYFFAERSDETFSPIGYLDGIRQVNMLYKNVGDEITLGSDTWKLLPIHTLSETLANVGFAVKK